MPQRPLKQFGLGNAKPVYLAFMLPSCRSYNKGSRHSALSSLCFQTPPPPRPGASSLVWKPPSLGVCEYNKLSFQWQLPPVLSALTYLSNSKTFISKHVPNLFRGFILPECQATVPISTPHFPSFHLVLGV